MLVSFFFFNDTATTEIYTLSLHDALPIWPVFPVDASGAGMRSACYRLPYSNSVMKLFLGIICSVLIIQGMKDRKSTRLNSSHANISYAVFCLKKNNLIYNYPPASPPLPTH